MYCMIRLERGFSVNRLLVVVLGLLLLGCQSLHTTDKSRVEVSTSTSEVRIERFYTELEQAKEYRKGHPVDAPILRKTPRQEETQ